MSGPTHLVVRIDELPPDLNAKLIKHGARPLVSTAASISWAEVYEKWLEHIKAGLSSRTHDSYSSIVKKMIGSEMSKPFRVQSSREISAWLNNPGWKHATRQLARYAIISFYEFALNEGLCMGNPARNTVAAWRDLPVNMVVPSTHPPFTHEEFEKILKQKRAIGFWKWGLQISYWMGLRMSDCVNLRYGNFGENELSICTSKTGDMLLLPYDHPQLGGGIIRKVRDELRSKRPDAPDYVFVFPMARFEAQKACGSIRARFNRLCTKAGVPLKGWHSLRRACIQRCSDAGMPLKSIGRIVGHKSTATTFKYINTPIPISELKMDKDGY